MDVVHIVYHYEDGTWWAESVDLPGWTAVASTADDIRNQVREAIDFFIDRPVDVEEVGLPLATITIHPSRASGGTAAAEDVPYSPSARVVVAQPRDEGEVAAAQ